MQEAQPPIRTRFAPSPTGYLHVGGLRTALYSYLHAKKHGGQFLLRIEDTDQERYVEGAEENLLKTLHWAGLNWDEGPEIGGQGSRGRHAPYRQSQRTELYRENAAKLLESGSAYRCFCTKERLDDMRAEQEMLKKPPMYDGRCRSLSAEEISEKLKNKEPFVVRQRIEKGKSVILDDIIRKKVRFETDTLDDQVLMKSDGFPTYHLANVVDDHLMEITHVIRGEEWLPSTPKHLLLYEAFGWQPPKFAHLPLLLNKDRQKLSKRHADVAVEDYIQKGYLPDAVVNFVALMGWHPVDNREIFSLEELIREFDLERVQKGGAIFDIDKLDWLTWQWRRREYETRKTEKTEDAGRILLGYCEQYLPVEWKADTEFLKKCLIAIEEKILKNPRETQDHLAVFFNDDVRLDNALLLNEKMGVTAPVAKKALEGSKKALEELDDADWDDIENIKQTLFAVVEKLGMKNGQVLWPVRVALSGEQFSPGAFEMAWALGKAKTIRHLLKYIDSL